jgi:hypothetical protein
MDFFITLNALGDLHLFRTKLEVKSMKRENSFPAMMRIRNDPDQKFSIQIISYQDSDLDLTQN